MSKNELEEAKGKLTAKLLTTTYPCEFCGKAVPITENMYRMFLDFEPTKDVVGLACRVTYLVCKDCENEIILMLEKMRKENFNRLKTIQYPVKAKS